MTLPLTMDVGELAPRHGFRRYGSAPCFKVQCPGLASSATIQSHILDLELAYPNTYPIYELLALVITAGSPLLGATAGYLRGVLVRVQ